MMIDGVRRPTGGSTGRVCKRADRAAGLSAFMVSMEIAYTYCHYRPKRLAGALCQSRIPIGTKLCTECEKEKNEHNECNCKREDPSGSGKPR